MIILDAIQGSPAWFAARAHSFNASEAAAMMGLSSKVKRNELLRMKKTCSEREFSDWVQENLLDRGHSVEAVARPRAEAHLGEELYPSTGYIMLNGDMYLASFDGVTMGGDVLWENKLWNDELAKAVDGGEVPNEHWPQLEHQLLVSGAEKTYFTVSNGSEQKSLWYTSVHERRVRLIAAWTQYKVDLAAYVAEEIIPAAVPVPAKALPAIIYKLNGLALTSNLSEFKAAAVQLVEDSKAPLQTDQDFADRDALNKLFKEAEEKIELVKEQVIGEVHDVDKFSRDLGHIGELIRQARLNGEKQIQARKDAIRLEIMQKGHVAFDTHIAGLNTTLGRPYMPPISVDFGGVMKGKRTIASLQDAVDTELARGKIEANAVGDRISRNLNSLRELAAEYTYLFADTAQIVLKANDDLVALVKLRIAEQKAKEEKKREEDRERIRREEADRFQREQAEREAEARRSASIPVTATATVPVKDAVSSTVPVGQTASLLPPEPAAGAAAVAAFANESAALRLEIDEALRDMSERELLEVIDAINSIRTAFGRDPAARRVA